MFLLELSDSSALCCKSFCLTIHVIVYLEQNACLPGNTHIHEIENNILKYALHILEFSVLLTLSCLLMFIVKDCDFFLRSEVITQLAAKEISTRTNFNRYIIPKIPISASAEKVTKISMVDETSMSVNGICNQWQYKL